MRTQITFTALALGATGLCWLTTEEMSSPPVATGAVAAATELPPSFAALAVVRRRAIPQDHDEGLDSAAALAARFPGAKSRLQARLEEPSGSPTEAVLAASRALVDRGSRAMATTLARHYSEGISIRAGDIVLSQRLLDAGNPAAVPLTGADRALTYPDVQTGVDAIAVAAPGRAEEFLLLRRGAARSFTYRMQITGPASLRDSGEHLEVVDAEGTPRLRLDDLVYWRAGDAGAGRPARCSITVHDDHMADVAIAIPEDEDLDRAVLLDPSWFLTGSLATTRTDFTLTLLDDGRVLVAGGALPGGGETSSCEIFDPITGTWSAAGSLKRQRKLHTATLLPDGRVLVAGGRDESQFLRQCEIFDPSLGTPTQIGKWTPTGAMIKRRELHAASYYDASGRMAGVFLPPPKGVLVSGSARNFSHDSAEVFDVATETWQTITKMAVGRQAHRQITLPNADVLVAGGFDNGGALASIERYDPSTGAWTDVTPASAPCRVGHSLTLIPANKNPLGLDLMLVVGRDVLTPAEPQLYVPDTGQWTPAGMPLIPRSGHTATLRPNGQVLFAGGHDRTTGAPLSSCEYYTPNGGIGVWSAAPSLNVARDYARATVLPIPGLALGRALIVGGVTAGGPSPTCEIFQ